MVNLLFISNDTRINGLIAYLQPLLRSAINSTADFDLGLKDVFDKRPDLVFIQRKIGGVSGDAVAQHIKELLRGKRPKIILLQDDSENAPVSSCYDDSVGFILQEPELYRAFQKYLEKFPEMPWRENLTAAPESIDAEPAAPDAAGPAVSPATRKPAEPVKKKPPQAPLGKPAPAPPKYSVPEEDEDDAVFGDIPFVYTPAKRCRWKVVGSIAAALILGVSIWGAFFWYSGGSKPSAHPGSGSERGVDLLHLPAVILASKADSDFSAHNPGWQKFVGERVEFRVYSEKETMKVIQAIVHGQAVGDEFMNAFLLDMFGSSDCSIASTAAKEGDLVQKGTAPHGSEIIIYRQEKTNLIKGFVISFA